VPLQRASNVLGARSHSALMASFSPSVSHGRKPHCRTTQDLVPRHRTGQTLRPPTLQPIFPRLGEAGRWRVLALEFGSSPEGIPEGNVVNFLSKALRAQDLSGSFCQQHPTHHQSPHQCGDIPGTPDSAHAGHEADVGHPRSGRHYRR